ncbi:MAG: PaaI family thioesterase [Candidatus Hydrogenedentales bacterium]
MADTFEGKLYLPNSHHCFVCGESNAAGLQTRFYIEEGLVKTRLQPQDHHCGYKDIVHGGVVAAVLDECMGWAASRALGRMCVTAELTIRYLKNVPADRPLTVATDVQKSNRLLAITHGRIEDDEGTLYARADAKFTPLSPEATIEVDDQLLYRGGEARLFDGLRASLAEKATEPGRG